MNLEGIREPYRSLLRKLLDLLLSRFSDRLVSVVVYGSVARGSSRPDSDIDMLIVVDSIPKSRMERQKIFLETEKPLEPIMDNLWSSGLYVDFSPIILSIEEASKIRPIYLDMVEDAIIIYDKGDFFRKIVDRLKRRLEELGAQRVWVGNKWYWILKPDTKFGEVIEIE